MGLAADSASASRERFMRVALQMAERGMAAGGPPVGACLVRDDVVIASGANQVVAEIDATAHAEITVLREACRAERALTVPGTTLYVTVEPCAMCLAACFYAGVEAVVYGAPISAMQAVTGRELGISSATLLAGYAAPTLTGGVLEQDCTTLLDTWAAQSGRSAGARPA